MSSSPAPKIRSRQIVESDFDSVSALLAKGFPDHNRYFWLRVFARLGDHSAPAGYPKYGYLLECGGGPVGVILLIFSKTQSGADLTTRCNVSSWYVEPAFRIYASALVSQALKVKE